MTRILCIGNRLWAEDAAGPLVHDELLRRGLRPGVELVDGGVAGLDLLPWFDHTDLVVVVDGVAGFGAEGEVVLLTGEEVGALAHGAPDHGAGLPHLLAVMPSVCERPPRVVVVGIEGSAGAESVALAADWAWQLTTEGAHGETE